MKTSLIFIIIFCLGSLAYGQTPYGNNPSAGGYYNTGDAKIYYEVYGSGSPVVLLHGGIYGDIDEFSGLIPELSKSHQVIAIVTRGHGRSELGHTPLSYELFAQDSYQVVRHLTTDSVTVIGFSDGAIAGYHFAADHPEMVKKLIAIGGNFGYTDYSGGGKAFMDNLSGTWMRKNQPKIVAARMTLMPDTSRFDEFIDGMARMWHGVYVSKEKIAAIQCPTLIMAGQYDGCPIEQYVALYRLLHKGQIAIIPGSNHLVMFTKPALTLEMMQAFMDNK